MTGGAWWDVFDPNKNGVANAFKPENVAKALDPAKNGVAEAFKAENVAKALDPAKNGFNDATAKLVNEFENPNSVLNDVSGKFLNELSNPDSALRSNIAPQLLGPLGGIALQGINSLQRAATNGTFTSGPEAFFQRLGNEFTNSNSDLVTKLLPAATRAVTGVNPNTLLKGLNGVRDMMQPQPMEEYYGEDEEVDTGADGAEEYEEEEDEEEMEEEQAEEQEVENVPFAEEGQAEEAAVDEEEPADMYEQAEEEKEEAEEEAQQAEETKAEETPAAAAPSGNPSARDGTEAKLISKLAWLFENPGEALPPGETTGAGGSRRRRHRMRPFHPRLLGAAPPPPLYSPGSFAR